jgi:ABC-type branched-subunit amino acid transport system permease subunit
MTERAPAFYALSGGGWRDWWTLLHPPYTLWHLSYVALGAAAAPTLRLDRLLATLLAFFFAVGLGAHALDELNGRPLRTRIAASALRATAAVSIAAAVAIGIAGIARVGIVLVPFIAFGAFIVVAYNLESFGGAFHSDVWFALAWGAFPALTASVASTESIRLEGVAMAAACFALSVAQRALSTPVRALRRRTESVDGTIVRADGSVEQIDEELLREAPEAALRALSVAMPLLAAAAVIARAI